MGADVRRTYGLFADLLDYPDSVPTEALRGCRELVASIDPASVPLLDDFQTYLLPATTGSLQEMYTRTFDLEATWHPYVGYHLFGETYQRSVFLVALKEHYERFGFCEETELPDHLPVVLRFLSICDDQSLADEIVLEGLLPMLVKISAGQDRDDADDAPEREQPRRDEGPEPYRALLDALTSLLYELYPQGPQFEPEEMTTPSETSVSLRTR
jgi:nitrate reductase delta subunit